MRVARVQVSSHQILDRRPSSLPCFLTAVPKGHLLPEPELLPVSASAAALSLEQGLVRRGALLWPPALCLSAFRALDVHGLHGWGWGVDTWDGVLHHTVGSEDR